jgi:hypothetical protein
MNYIMDLAPFWFFSMKIYRAFRSASESQNNAREPVAERPLGDGAPDPADVAALPHI